jgi:Family of unknown function (DUF6011)
MTIYRKLDDGSWGVSTGTQAQSGDVVTVTTRAGAVKRETLGDFVGVDRFSGWQVFRIAKAPQQGTLALGDLGGVLALFAKAKQHLKYPAIVLDVREIGSTLRLSIAGPQAKVPGSITVTSGGSYGDREWLGRVTTDGNYQPSRAANGRTDAIVKRLQAFACDPAGVAKDNALLTGRCCFCNLPLKDERSTAVGYGQTCASHWGQPWGVKPVGFGEGV